MPALRRASGRPHVAVRRVAGGVELRVDGTLASVYRPGRALTGVVWWTLAAPVLLAPRPAPRVLLLGLAAGSVARAVRALAPAAEIVGVEIDREVLRAARRHFGLGRIGVEVVAGDALAYLRRERRLFDVVVEDLFVGSSRSVRKPDWLLGEGYPLIGRRLRRDGIVVSNTIHEMPRVAAACRRLGGGHGRRLLCLDVAGHWNRIVVAGASLPGAAAARRRLAAVAPLARRVAFRTLRGAATIAAG